MCPPVPPTSNDRSAPSCRRRLLGAAALALLICLPVGCSRPAPTEEKPPPANVKWEGPLLSNLEEWTELVGTTVPLPDRLARISAPVGGVVVSVRPGPGRWWDRRIAEGDRVSAGTVLVRLDPAVVNANLAKLNAAQDVLVEEQTQARLASELAAYDLDRLRKLKEEEDKRLATANPGVRLVSPVDLDKADFALKDARSKLAAATGRVAGGKKDIEALQEQLKLYSVTTPVAGRLGRIQVAPGQSLAAGAPIADVVDLDEAIDVLCFVPPALAARLQSPPALAARQPPPQPAVTGGHDEGPPERAKARGQVVYVADQAEAETGNFAVKIRFPNKEARLRANRVLRVRVLCQPGKECLTLPEKAVQEDEEKPTVVLVVNVRTEKNAEGKEETLGEARRVPVVLGLRDRNNHLVEFSFEDPKLELAKNQALVITKDGQGVQTGDVVKLKAEDD
jgi:RND family efflux transporter MFP subunit